ncbi:MAG: TonB-dependent receptor [Novosphingobium sp.]|nr:TonB-dependent receptor [Novosphingobium sp.]
MKAILWGSTLLFGGLAGSPAFAQESGQPQADAGDVIIVTARKKEESLQQVPIAVTAIGGEQLASKNVVRFQDLQQVTAGLTVQSSAFGNNIPSFTIRGQRQFAPYMTLDPSTAIYFADVVQSRPQGLNAAMYDLESVQVLKGPQGTLYGRNTTGGAVLIAPKKPEAGNGGYARLVLGNYDLRTIEGAANLAFGDHIQFRAAGQIARRDGYTPNHYNGVRLDDEHNENWRLSLRLRPAEGIENLTVVNGFHARENGVGYKLVALADPAPPGIVYPDGYFATLAAIRAQPFHSTNSDLVNPAARIKTFGLSNVTTIDIGEVQLKNVLGYRHVKSFVAFDFDGSPAAFFPSLENVRSNMWSDELQLQGKALGGTLDWIVGAYFFQEKGSDQQTSTFLAVRDSKGDIVNRSYSGFVQLNYHVPGVDGLSATAGVRITKDIRKFDAQSTVNGNCRFGVNPCSVKRRLSYAEPTYHLGLDWRVTPDVLVYVSHSRGYHSGAFNFLAGNLAALDNPADPEFVMNYEAGLKTDWRIGDRPGRLNLAVYRQDYSGIQRVVGAVVNGTFVSSLVNAAEARIQGLEAELSFSPAEFLKLSAHYAYTDPKYTRFDRAVPGGGAVDISPTRFIASKHVLGGEARLTLPVNDRAGRIELVGSAYYQSRTTFNEQNYDGARFFPTSFIAPYTLLNARVEWSNIMGSNASLAGFVRNLTDKHYYAGGTDLVDSAGTTGVFLGAPRTYGLELAYRF